MGETIKVRIGQTRGSDGSALSKWDDPLNTHESAAEWSDWLDN